MLVITVGQTLHISAASHLQTAPLQFKSHRKQKFCYVGFLTHLSFPLDSVKNTTIVRLTHPAINKWDVTTFTCRFRSALSRCCLLFSLTFCRALYSEHCSSSRAFFRCAAAWAMTSACYRLALKSGFVCSTLTVLSPNASKTCAAFATMQKF